MGLPDPKPCRLQAKHPIPREGPWEGLIIDDYFVLPVEDRSFVVRAPLPRSYCLRPIGPLPLRPLPALTGLSVSSGLRVPRLTPLKAPVADGVQSAAQLPRALLWPQHLSGGRVPCELRRVGLYFVVLQGFLPSKPEVPHVGP